MAECRTCSSWGAVTCPKCQGKGRVYWGVFGTSESRCSNCEGSGKVKCGVCHGIGRV